MYDCEHKHVTVYAFARYGFLKHQCNDCDKRWETKDVNQAFSETGYIKIPCTCDIDKDHCFHHTDKKICGLCDKVCLKSEKGESIGSISWACDSCANGELN